MEALEVKVHEENSEHEHLKAMIKDIKTSLVMYTQEMTEMSQGIEKE